MSLIPGANAMQPPPSADVRQYLVEKYTDEDLEVLCADYFRDVSNDFAVGMSKGQKIQRLIEHCLRQDRWINLLAALRQTRPDQFRERFTQASPAPVEAASPRPARNPRQAFISHAHQDAEFASRLAADLRQRGWQAWIAPDSIRPGEKWVTAIERGLAGSGVFLAVLTPDALDSPWVEDETHEAIELSHERKLRLLTLLVKPCDLSGRLIRRQQHVLFTGRYEDGLARLMEALSPQEPAPAKPAAIPAAAPASPTSAPDQLVIEQPFHLELVRVPAGEFLMGSDPKKDTAAVDREQPQRRVSLPEYHIGRYPVTNAQYAACAKATRLEFQAPEGKENHPVVEVSWSEAVAFCQWLSETTGQPFRLPTEAEWEKAARGTDGRIYPWGDQWDKERANTRESGAGGATPVGQYSPAGDSPYGAVDMAGNVWEWTADWYDKDYYAVSPAHNPMGPSSGNYRVARGGSWSGFLHLARCACRFTYPTFGETPNGRDSSYGFRVARAGL